ncbi:hypothetical protein BJ742DRAFT_571821 [Cladochytrium replicatum]|nr:hypothetical protein BJ742DRAFT_571821 [Cladochytrium replicatum]
MVRKLKFHEQKLLKKVDFLQWKTDPSIKENEIMKRYHLQRREEYIKYNKLGGQIRKLANKIALLKPQDPFRDEMTTAILNKLSNMGLITVRKALSEVDKISVSAFCRRRLPVVMVRLKMAQTVRQAVTLVEQGHVRVGPDTITDPAYFVTRTMEDYVTWVDSSKIKRKVMAYNDKLDDFDLL